MTKKTVFVAILAALLALLSGCATNTKRNGGGGWGGLRSLALPPILTIVITNNTVVPIEVFENGLPVMLKDAAGNLQRAVLPSGGTVSRGYYNFLGRRDLVITVRGICPPTPPAATVRTAGCVSGQYAGTASRQFSIYTDGQYHTDHWEVNYLRGPQGVY